MEKLKFILGFGILFLIYYVSMFLVKLTHIAFPPAILGLILFTLALFTGIIKEEWVEKTANFLLKNMAVLFVPFVVGLIVYKDILLQNWLSILLVIFVTTTVIIVSVGLFVEYGLKLYEEQKDD